MEKKKIVLGIEAMENFEKIFHPLLITDYEFYTTSYVWNTDSWSRSCTDAVCVKDFDGTEVEKCFKFIHKNDLASKVGMSNGTALFYAMFSNKTLFVTDHLTEMICRTLGVSYLSEMEMQQHCQASSITKLTQSMISNESNVVSLCRGTASSSYKQI